MTSSSDRDKPVSSVVDFPESRSLQSQAAKWLAKLDAHHPAAEDLEGFRRWVNEHPDNRQAFEEVAEFWDEMNVLTQIVLPREEQDTGREKRHQSPGTRWWPAGFVAAMLLVVATLFVPWNQSPSPIIYSTEVGESQSIELPDHSTVFLNTNSRIEVVYNDQLRGIKLLQGEAHFDVHHDPTRPFEVYARTGTVRAVGTAFSVHLRSADVEVIVTEGVVEIAAAHPSATDQPAASLTSDQLQEVQLASAARLDQTFQVKAGNSAVFDPFKIEQITLAAEDQVEQKLSWREGLLVFDGEPLAMVVEEVSRYTSLKIIIPERKAREMKVGGVFKIGDTESMFEALREGFGIHNEYVSDDMVYLISAENR